MTDERPPLLTGGARRSRIRSRRRRRRGSRSRDRRPRISRILFLVPFVGGIALAAILLGSIVVRMVPAFKRMQECIDGINRILREQITGLRVVRE